MHVSISLYYLQSVCNFPETYATFKEFYLPFKSTYFIGAHSRDTRAFPEVVPEVRLHF